MFKNLALALVGATMLAPVGAAQAAFIDALSDTPMLIGMVTAGTTYNVTTSGISNLNTNFNSPNGLTFTADGKPTYDFPAPYSAFDPNGLDYDPSQPSHPNGVGGPGELYGALLGTYSATSGPYFMLGGSATFTASSTGAIYGLVNDCSACYADNAGGFNVTLSPSTVPLPASAPMFGAALVAFGAVGYGLKRRGKAVTQA